MSVHLDPKSIEKSEQKARQELVEVARLCYSRGYICGVEGNFSIRFAEDKVLTTPRGTCKARIEPNDLIVTDLKGNVLGHSSTKPSTELQMHLTAYEERPDARAVVHAHPTVAVGFTVAGVSLSKCILPEVVCTLGHVPVAPYATPSTEEVSNSIRDVIRTHDALVLDHHGALTVGSDIWDAYYKLETIEHHAQTLLVAHMLGGPKPLMSSQVQHLLDICGIYGVKPPADAHLLTSSEMSRSDAETSA